jgi:hypothetical protein
MAAMWLKAKRINANSVPTRKYYISASRMLDPRANTVERRLYQAIGSPPRHICGPCPYKRLALFCTHDLLFCTQACIFSQP